MKTSVEWLLEQLEQHHIKIDIKNTVAFEQAKEMEKQQMKDFAMELSKIDCSKTGTDILIDEAENLYNQTFKSE